MVLRQFHWLQICGPATHRLPARRRTPSRWRRFSVCHPSSGPPAATLPCIGDLIGGTGPSQSGCQMKSSNLISAPYAEGVDFLPTCDLHQRRAAKWAVQNLGAAGLIHPSLLKYMVAGLASGGWTPQRSGAVLRGGPRLAADQHAAYYAGSGHQPERVEGSAASRLSAPHPVCDRCDHGLVAGARGDTGLLRRGQ